MTKLNSNPKAILFDIGDTIVKPRKSFKSVILEEFKSISLTTEVNNFDYYLSKVIKNDPIDPELTWCSDQSIDAALEKRYLKAFANEDEKYYSIARYLTEYIRKPDAWDVMHNDTMSILSQLKKHYYLGVISNWGTNLQKLLEHLNIRDFFDVLICSAEVGVAKPNIEIFQMALSRLKELENSITSSEVVFVGDNIQQDVIPAKVVGFQPIYLNENKGVNEIDKVIQVKSLSDLLHYF